MYGPYQGRDISNCGVGRLHIAINCGVLSVNHSFISIVYLLVNGFSATCNNNISFQDLFFSIQTGFLRPKLKYFISIESYFPEFRAFGNNY